MVMGHAVCHASSGFERARGHADLQDALERVRASACMITQVPFRVSSAKPVAEVRLPTELMLREATSECPKMRGDEIRNTLPHRATDATNLT